MSVQNQAVTCQHCHICGQRQHLSLLNSFIAVIIRLINNLMILVLLFSFHVKILRKGSSAHDRDRSYYLVFATLQMPPPKRSTCQFVLKPIGTDFFFVIHIQFLVFRTHPEKFGPFVRAEVLEFSQFLHILNNS